MAADALSLVKELQAGTDKLRAVADNVEKNDLTAEFGNILANVIATLNTVNTDLCVGTTVFVSDYDLVIKGALASFLALSNQLGGEIAEQSALLKQAFEAQRAFMATVAKCKKPSDQVLGELLKPTGMQITAMNEYRESRRSSKVFNHLSALSEACPMMGWVTIDLTPGPYLADMRSAATFYTNRVLTEYKGKDQNHVEWTKSLIKLIQELEAYVKKHHLTGLSWNRQGEEAVAAAAPAPPPAPGGPGGPPPPPPPVVAPTGPAAPSSDDSGKAALLADLNRGADVTVGLKKVTDDMKTHKNPNLRKQAKPVSSSPTPYKAPAAASKVKAPAAAAVKKPPRLELTLKTWNVEYFENNPSIKIEQAEMKHTVYIYKCVNSTVHIPSKINSITIDGCKKLGLAFESALGSVDIINSQSVQVQVLGKAPIINVDKTDGFMVYLSEDSKDTQIISAKSSEMNVLIPSGSDGDFTEFPLPEQYKSSYNGKKVVTEIFESLG